jgi:glycosyltransferase involved in cell wall biosynthesis
MNKPGDYPKVSVVICALNEEQNLPHVLPGVPQWVDEVLLVDGNSTDNTVEVARKLRPGIRTIYQSGKGKGNALKCGNQQAAGDIIVTLDADGETNPEDIPRFVEPLLDGYEFAKGSRLMDGRPPSMPWHRWFGNKVLAITSNILYGTRYTDVCSGYNAYWKSTFQHLNPRRDGFEVEQEVLAKATKAGLKVVEVNHRDNGRIGSNSKVSAFYQGFVDLIVIIRERFCD